MKKFSLIFFLMILALISCSTESSGGGSNPGGGGGGGDETFLIQADIETTTNFLDEIVLSGEVIFQEEEEFSPITTGATVTVNGETLSDAMIMYVNRSLTAVSPGENLNLNILYSDSTFSANIEMPDRVNNITADLAFPYDAASDLTLSWDTEGYTSVPDSITVFITGDFETTVSLSDGQVVIPGGTVSDFASTQVNFSSTNEQSIVADNCLGNSYIKVRNVERFVISTQ